LIEININNGKQKTISIPTLSEEDAISYLAVNPQDSQEIVFTTFQKDIYITNNNGEQWEKIADKGTGSSL
jgi:hypothetical protein